MKTKSSETAPDPQSAARTFAEWITELDGQGQVAGPTAPYTGPPFGLFRELDFAPLEPRSRALVQTLGRHLWQNFQTLRLALLHGTEPSPPPLDLAASAVAAELQYNAATLAATLPTTAAPAQNLALLETSRQAVRSLEALGSALETSVRLDKVGQP